MKKYLLKILFFILKSFVYTKKALFFLVKSFFSFFRVIDNSYKRTLGFRIYKMIFSFKKKFFNFVLNIKNQSKLEIFGSRTFLQFIFLFFIFIIILPQTKLIEKKNISYGRDSLLFSLVGPGSQDFTLEEISFDLNANIETNQGLDSWKTGVITSVLKNEEQTFETINSLAVGGTVLKKPIYISSLDFKEFEEDTSSISQNTGRKETIIYEVEPGDVIGKIAQKFALDINTILWANNLTINSYIRPGDKLVILPVSGITHKIISGDTILKIARIYDASVDEIINFNNLSDGGKNIKIGQLLIIPNGKKVQVSTSQRPASYNTVAAAPASASVPAGTGYLWPTSASIITQYFGWRHGGLDIAGPVGTALYATKAGKVLASQCGWNWGYGCYVHLDHGNGVQSIYAHASVLYVDVGDYVTQGQTIAGMGSTGNSTGPHIHFEIRVNGVRQNPLAYVRK
jgi:LysM repeat protein